MHEALRRVLIAAVLALPVALAGCATPSSVPFGSSETEVVARLGKPGAVHPLPGGGKRLQYSGQPFEQQAWMVDLDARDKVVRVEQVLTDEVFARVRAGQDTRADILREFGRPAEVYRFALRNEDAYMYRYVIQGGFPAAMFIYFDADGRVLRTETGLDPWTIKDSDRK